jgi:hypothetical protein
MLTVNECVLQSKQVVVIILVVLAIELRDISRRSASKTKRATNQIQHRNLHHTLVEVCSLVLDYFNSHHFSCFEILAFHDLTKRTLAQNIENEVPISKFGKERLSVGKSISCGEREHTCGRLLRCRGYR